MQENEKLGANLYIAPNTFNVLILTLSSNCSIRMRLGSKSNLSCKSPIVSGEDVIEPGRIVDEPAGRSNAGASSHPGG
jgi:hypothetical protein